MRQFSTQVFRFLDGSEQRFPGYGAPLRRWVIRLDLLDEAELATLEQFFEDQGGRAGTFSFTDPLDGTVYASCSFDSDELRGSCSSIVDTGRTARRRWSIGGEPELRCWCFHNSSTGAAALYPVTQAVDLQRTVVNTLWATGRTDVLADPDAALVAWELHATGLTAAEMECDRDAVSGDVGHVADVHVSRSDGKSAGAERGFRRDGVDERSVDPVDGGDRRSAGDDAGDPR